MTAVRILAIVLIAGGAVSLVYHGFTYTKDTHTADVGSLHITLAERQYVGVPVWAAIGVIVGGVLLLAGTRK